MFEKNVTIIADFINFMSTYINCLYFISGILEPYSIKDHLQLRGDLFKVSRRLMLFFLLNNFSVIDDISHGDIEYITNITTLMI